MVVLNKIYTKTGDDGKTSLGNGERRDKHDIRVEAYGTVDEANSVIGIARIYAANENPKVEKILEAIQNDLFDLGADLCTPESKEQLEYEPLRVTAKQVEQLESAIDELNSELQPLRSFILPGGTALAAYLHQARTIARRAERQVVLLNDQKNEVVTPQAILYLNRLSDLLFVAARYVNNLGRDDVLWVPGKNR